MIKLIKLEWTKHSLWKYLRNGAITTALVLGMLLLIGGDDPTTWEIVPQLGKSTIHALTELFLNMCYNVFTGVMLASFIVGEYESKLIHLMFSYPIRRWKILLSKILAVCLFTFLVLVASKALTCGVLTAVYAPEAAALPMGELSFWTGALASAAVSVLSGCISLLVGTRMKSSKAAIISAFVIMLVVMGITQGNVMPLATAGGLIGYAVQILGAVAAVALSIHGVGAEDVI